MSGFTVKGHRLEHVAASVARDSLIFQCVTPSVMTNSGAWILSQLVVCVPVARELLLAHLRHWLAVYEDPELLERVEGVVEEALKKLAAVPPPLPPVTPPPPPADTPPTLN